jgi:hypothetical protein
MRPHLPTVGAANLSAHQIAECAAFQATIGAAHDATEPYAHHGPQRAADFVANKTAFKATLVAAHHSPVDATNGITDAATVLATFCAAFCAAVCTAE